MARKYLTCGRLALRGAGTGCLRVYQGRTPSSSWRVPSARPPRLRERRRGLLSPFDVACAVRGADSAGHRFGSIFVIYHLDAGAADAAKLALLALGDLPATAGRPH
ncbi:hypothetical protein GCM10009735_22470 [Actinomadura chokoriensis]